MWQIRIRKTYLVWVLLVLISLFIAGLRIVILVTERTDDKEQLLVPSDQDKTINLLLIYEINAAKKQVYGIIRERKLPGLAIAVSIRDKLVWSQVFGYADLEKKQLATTETRFRINSISKLFTAALAARLHEQRKLDFDIDIRNYLPEFPDKGYTITSRELACHRSGIRGYRDDAEAVRVKHYDNVSQSLESFKDDTLLFKPGTDFLYSGYGYVLLSAVLEKAGKGDFLQLMKKEVIVPLGMNHTAPASYGGVTGEASCYDNVTPYSPDGSIVASPPNDFSFKWAAGGFVSTAEDLVKFGNAHINSLHHKFLNNQSVDQLFKPQTIEMGILEYGMGWMSARDPHMRKAYFHFGAGSGGTSLLLIYPNQKLSIVLLTNLGHAKFPYNRIMGIVNSFQSSPTKIIFNCWLALFIFYLLFVSYRYFRNLF